MSYAPYEFKETNLILDKDRKDCYFDEYRYIYFGPMDRWGHIRNNDHLKCLKYSDKVNPAEVEAAAEAAAKAEARAEAKKNKKLWVKKKKEKLLEYKNRGLKR
jgi:predicted GIY-YIG superfamily endonuclease